MLRKLLIEEVEEEINFVIEDEIVEAIVEEIKFDYMDEVDEEMVISVERNSSQEITNSRTNDYKCHKNSGSHIFYEHNSLSKYLKEIIIGRFIDQEGLFVFNLHARFKVWENFALWDPWNDYILHFQCLNKYVIDVMRKSGERLDFTDYDLANDDFVLFSCIDQKQKGDFHITFDKNMMNWHDFISFGNDFSPWEVGGEYQHLLLIKNRLNWHFYTIGDGDFSLVTRKQQEQLFLDDGRILYPLKDDMRETSKKGCVHGGSDQARKEALCGNSYAKILCCPQTKDIFITSTFVAQKHQEQWCEIVMQVGIVCGYMEGQVEEKGWCLILKLEVWPPLNVFEEWLICHDIHVMASSLLFYLNFANKFQQGSWKIVIGPRIPMIFDGDPDLHHGHYITNLYLLDTRKCNTFGMLKSDQKEEYVIFILAGYTHQVRDFKIAWNVFSPTEKIVACVNERKSSSFLINDERAELRTIPFEEGGNDTCMDRDKGWLELNDS